MFEPAAPAPATSLTSGGVDVLILCALQDELDAVLALGEGGRDRWAEQRDSKGFRCYRRTLDNERGGALRVAAAWAGEMGAVVAASRAQQLIGELNPACLSMCGICAGDREKVALGDVIVADQLYRYDEGKVVAPEGKPAVMWNSLKTFDLEATWKMDAAFLRRELDFSDLGAARPRSRGSQRRWLLWALLSQEEGGVEVLRHPERKVRVPDWTRVVKAAQDTGLVALRAGKMSLTEEGKEQALNEQVLYVDGLPEDPLFQVHVGAIATGSAVQEDGGLFDRLRRLVRTTLGVEMEGAALGEVAARFGRKVLLVKAVSDHADEEKDDSFRGFACRASATVLVELLKRLVEPGERRGESHFKALAAYTEVLEDAVDQRFEEEHKRASQLFLECRYAEAREAYERIRSQAEPLAERASAVERPALRRWVEQCKLNEAAASLNLQEIDVAKTLLDTIDTGLLPPKMRLSLAEQRASLGDVDKAAAMLAEVEESGDERLRTRKVEIQQRIDICRDQIPEDLVAAAPVRLDATVAFLERHDLHRAADLALGLLKTEPDDRLITAHAATLLTDALVRTVFENPPSAVLIPVERRAEILAALESDFDTDKRNLLPPSVLADYEHAEDAFRHITHDDDRLAERFALRGADDNDEDDAPRQVAFRLAVEGHADEALRVMSALTDDHPWRSRLDRVELLAVGNQLDRALDEGLDLVRDFPSRAPIEHITAQLCARTGRPDEALEHAKEAYRLLPGNGYLFLLVTQYVVSNKAEAAWGLVKDVKDDRPRALYMRALAAEHTGHAEEAERAWRRYAELRPEDAAARVMHAQLLFRMHRIEESAASAWKVFLEHADRLDLDALYICGALQRLAGPLTNEQTQRIRQVASRIKARFPSDARAEFQRFQLLIMLDNELPDDVEPLNQKILIDAGFLEARPVDEMEAFFTERASFLDAVSNLARQGAISTTAALTLANIQPALFVTHILRGGQSAAGLLCPPVFIADQLPRVQLRGATLLISDPEMLLLEALEVTALLRDALGPDGRLVLFRSAQARMLEDFSKLRIASNPKKLAEFDALIRDLESIKVLEADPEAPYDDIAAARKHNASVVDDTVPADVNPISPLAFLRLLNERGCIDDDQYHRIARNFKQPSDTVPEMSRDLPELILLPWPIVEKLFQEGVLLFVAASLGGRLRIGPRARAHFLRERSDLADTIEAERLAERVCRRLSEGWIAVVEPPPANDVPPLREPAPLWGEELILEPLREALSYRYAMIENPTWWRVSADFFGTNAFGAPGLTDKLAWAEPRDYQELMRKIRRAGQREMTMPALARMLVANVKEADAKLVGLAKLGFSDALGPSELLRLERRYKGLDKDEPRRILDNQEWMAREPAHLGGPSARLRLAQTYAIAIWYAFCNEDGTPTLGRSTMEQSAIVRALLERQERIGEASYTSTVDQTLQLLASRMLGSPLAAWKRQKDGYVSDDDGAVAHLWQAVDSWIGKNSSRLAAHDRALREIWLLVDRRKDDGPSFLEAMTLSYAHSLRDGIQDGYAFSPEAGLEALAILSARWQARPLKQRGIDVKVPGAPQGHEQIDLEQVLERGVASFAAGEANVRMGRTIEYSITIPGQDGIVPVRAPVEAVFMRMNHQGRASMLSTLKLGQGRHDGRLCQLLDELEQGEANPKALRKYARRAVSSLFRLVRDDPAYLRVWPQVYHVSADGNRPSIEDLLVILSEPNEPLPEDITSVLPSRPTGVWKDRDDVGLLFVMASEIPGMFAAAPLRMRLDSDDYDRAVQVALRRMERPAEFPIARIAQDIIFLRVASTRQPHVKLPEGEADLREILPDRLERVLERVTNPPEPDTYELAEAPLLRVCGDVVQCLAHRKVLPFREGLWLTWRLFQWLCLQLDAIAPDARRDGIRRLVANAPPSQVRRDVLDPHGFDRNHPEHFDHRLGAVLHALGAMEELVVVFNREKPPEKHVELRRASSPALEKMLVEVAQRVNLGPPVGSVLAWSAPDNVPDLALNALLRLNHACFADLSIEARTRRFKRLPEDPQALSETNAEAVYFAAHILLAAAESAARLTPEERALLEDKLHAMADGPVTRRWRWLVFVSLFETGMSHLEDEARALVAEHAKDPRAAVAFGRLLLGIAALDPARVEPAVETVMTAATQQGADAGTLAAGALGRLVVHGAPEGQKVAAALILELADREEFREHRGMQEVIGFFRLRDTSA